jgi:hypothetical protein
MRRQASGPYPPFQVAPNQQADWRRVKELVTCSDEQAATGIQDPFTERLCREACKLGKGKKAEGEGRTGVSDQGREVLIKFSISTTGFQKILKNRLRPVLMILLHPGHRPSPQPCPSPLVPFTSPSSYHNGVQSSKASACQHSHHKFQDHRHVDGHSVTLLNA